MVGKIVFLVLLLALHVGHAVWYIGRNHRE